MATITLREVMKEQERTKDKGQDVEFLSRNGNTEKTQTREDFQ